MLELAYVLTTGGILLFSSAVCPDPQIFSIVIGKILESKLLECSLAHNCWSFEYSYDSILGLVFVAIWRKENLIEHVGRFLKFLQHQFESAYKQIQWKGDTIVEVPDFSENFRNAYEKWVRYVEYEEKNNKVMMSFKETEAGRKISKKKKVEEVSGKQQPASQQTNQPTDQAPEVEKSDGSPEQSPEMSPELSPRSLEEGDGDLSPREKFLQKQKSENEARKKKAKKPDSRQNLARTWDFKKNISEKDIDTLDASRNRKSAENKLSQYTEEPDKALEQFVDSDKEVEQSTFFKKMIGSVQKVIGNKSLTEEDLKPVLTAFKQRLMEKNVALQVADKITESVGQTLLETKTKSFTSIEATVRGAIHDALVKILTPKRHIDLVADVAKAKLEHKPYVAVFIGVNGVGKSTNLAKVAYMLKNSGFSVMLAACDNFRAGAVEQLKVHGKALDIPVFDRGYKEQPPEIAYQAIKEATAKRIDVVLIDTAGRMQDNTPLMKALSRLVSVNKPNLVVFIGEALVGNDAIDQITKFNEAISEYSPEDTRREIDAIILSKFDTVDDKVGTAVSMCYSTSKPILYVGVGQKYQNLRKLNINTIVHALMS